MIKGSFFLAPPGSERMWGIAQFEVCTVPALEDGRPPNYPVHHYRVIAGPHVFEGEVRKTASGHRNLFHLLADICEDIFENNPSLPLNYLPTPEGALKWREAQAKSISQAPSQGSAMKAPQKDGAKSSLTS